MDTQTGPSVAVQASVNLSAPTLPKGVTPTITAVGDEKDVTPTITVVGNGVTPTITAGKGVTPTITATGDEKVVDNKPQDKTSSKDKENVVDADFEDVKEDKEKSA